MGNVTKRVIQNIAICYYSCNTKNVVFLYLEFMRLFFHQNTFKIDHRVNAYLFWSMLQMQNYHILIVLYFPDC